MCLPYVMPTGSAPASRLHTRVCAVGELLPGEGTRSVVDDLLHRVRLRLGEEAIPARVRRLLHGALAPRRHREAHVAVGALHPVSRVPLAGVVSRGVEAELEDALDEETDLALGVGEQMLRRLRAAVAARDVVDDVVRRELDELVRLADRDALARLDRADELVAAVDAAVDAPDLVPRNRDAPAGAPDMRRILRRPRRPRSDDGPRDQTPPVASHEAGHGRTSFGNLNVGARRITVNINRRAPRASGPRPIGVGKLRMPTQKLQRARARACRRARRGRRRRRRCRARARRRRRPVPDPPRRGSTRRSPRVPRQQLQIGPPARAVAVDRGAHDAPDAGVPAALECRRRRQLRRLEPARRPHDAARDVDRDHEPLAERGDELLQRTPRTPPVPTITRAIPASAVHRVRAPAHAAAQLQRTGAAARSPPRRARPARRRPGRHRAPLRGRAGETPRPPLARARAGRRRHLHPVVVSPQHADGPPVEHVDGGNDCELCFNVLAWEHDGINGASTLAGGDHAELFAAIASMKTADETAHLSGTSCTVSELDAMAHRWQVAQLLDEGLPYSRWPGGRTRRRRL